MLRTQHAFSDAVRRRGMGYARSGRVEMGSQAGDVVVADVQGSESEPYCVRLSLLWPCRDARGAAAHVQALCVIARIAARATFTRPVTRPVRLWCEAEQDFLRGWRRRGLRRLRAAVASAESFRLPFETAQLKNVLARRLERDDPERAALLASARSMFGALGAEWELGALQEPLA